MNSWRGLYDTRRSLGSTCLSSVRHECVRQRPASSARRMLDRLLRFVGSTALLDHGTKVGSESPVGTGGKSRSLKNRLPRLAFCSTEPRFVLGQLWSSDDRFRLDRIARKSVANRLPFLLTLLFRKHSQTRYTV